MESISIADVIGIAGTVAFAVTAVLAVSPKGIDFFGACVMGIITAVGGGTIRDLILEVPVFWSQDLSYIWIALGASIAAFAAGPLFARKRIYSLMVYIDGLAVALFAVQAVDKVWSLGFGLPLAPIILGIITAIGGGLIRDILAGCQNLLMTRELYAIPVMLGCVSYVTVLELIPQFRELGMPVCALFIFGMRAAAIHWNLSVPEFLTTKKIKEETSR